MDSRVKEVNEPLLKRRERVEVTDQSRLPKIPRATRDNNAKRYNLVLPEAVYREIETIAEEEQITIIEVFRQFIRLGLIAREIDKDANSQLLIKRGDEIREIVFL